MRFQGSSDDLPKISSFDLRRDKAATDRPDFLHGVIQTGFDGYDLSIPHLTRRAGIADGIAVDIQRCKRNKLCRPVV